MEMGLETPIDNRCAIHAYVTPKQVFSSYCRSQTGIIKYIAS